MDEVPARLMPIFVDKVFDALSELNRRQVSILLVEQNARKSLSTMSSRFVLETGWIALEGSSEEPKSNPEVQKMYLGALVRRENSASGFGLLFSAGTADFEIVLVTPHRNKVRSDETKTSIDPDKSSLCLTSRA